MSDVNAKDAERAKFVFSVYDFEAQDKIDAFNLGDALRALDLKPNLKAIEKLGGTKKKGEKFLKFDEFLSIFGTVKKEKDIGTYSEFMEIMKLYDKVNNGSMLVAELTHLLQSLGEVMTKEEAENCVKDTCEVDDEGFIYYGKFLKKLLAGPFPEND